MASRRDDGDGDRQHQVQGAGAGDRQHQNDRFGPVGHRGERVERQGGEPLDRGDARRLDPLRRPGWADEEFPDSGAGAPARVRVGHVRHSTNGALPTGGFSPKVPGRMELWELVARERCRDTLARYTHAGDRFRLNEYVAAFCEDGVLEVRGATPLQGRAPFWSASAAASANRRRPARRRPPPEPSASSATTSPTSSSSR